MYQVFSKNLLEDLHSRAAEVIDIIDYMAQTSGDSPTLTKGIKTLAASRDIKLIIVRTHEPPIVIASNKTRLIGTPANKIFSEIKNSSHFEFDKNTDQYTAMSSIWLENKFNNGRFKKATVGIIFDTYKTRTALQDNIINTLLYLILTTIFVVLFAYLSTNKYIFKPLEIINSSLNKNNSNNEFSTIPLSSNDEIGTVAKTLNQLFTDLYSSKKDLRENTWDLINNNLYCSRSLKEILGIDDETFSPTIDWFEKRTHEEDKENAHVALLSHLKNDTEYDVEGRLQHENGEYIWMRVRGRAVRDHTGKAIRMVGYYVDISKRKENEKLMNSLYLLSADATLPLNKKINCILTEGVNYLGLDCGLICKISGEDLSTTYLQCPKEYQLNEQSTFKLKETFCSYTIQTDSISALHNISESHLCDLPEHTELGINCYIGIPLYIHDRIYGTVSFSDFKIRSKPFTEHELSFVKLISHWISNCCQ